MCACEHINHMHVCTANIIYIQADTEQASVCMSRCVYILWLCKGKGAETEREREREREKEDRKERQRKVGGDGYFITPTNVDKVLHSFDCLSTCV